MKKIVEILISIFITGNLFFGYAEIGQDEKGNEKSSTSYSEKEKKEEGVAEQQDKTEAEKPSQQVKKELNIAEEDKHSFEMIKACIENQEKSIISKDKDAYMETISKAESQFYWERVHWIEDIISGDIKDYSLKIESAEKVEDGKFILGLRQQYKCNNKEYDLLYENIYKIEEDRVYDCDLNWKSIESEHFIVKYLGNLEDEKWFPDYLESAYTIATERLNQEVEERIVIKIYDDLQLLRQSFKLTFTWEPGGWYEYPESVKTIDLVLKGEDDERFKYVVVHEMVHMITMNQTNNNLPYWLAEGLATYFASREEEPTMEYWNISLDELEKMNLETLEGYKISHFYMNSKYYVTKFIELYGVDKLNAVLDDLKSYGVQEKTVGAVYLESNEKFKKSVKKVMGIDFEELCEKLQE